MTNHWIHRFGGGRSPGLRSPGGGRRTWVLLLVLGWLASASASLAAEIVEVRVGRHPTFTRVVFELDRAAGYRIERSDPSQDGPELVVSLQARSEARTLRSSKSFIEQVDVEPMGSTSVARVRLAKGDLRLKEMILTNPPRIVLDLLDEGAVAKAVGAKKPAAVAESKASSTARESDGEAQAFDAVVAGIDGDRGTKTKPAPVEKPVEPVKTAKAEPKPAPAPKAAPKPAPAPAPAVAKQTAPPAEATASAAAAKGAPVDMAESLFDDDPQSAAADAGAAGLAANAPGAPGAPIDGPRGDALAQAGTTRDAADAAKAAQPMKAAQPKMPSPTKAAEPRKPRPMVATSTTGDDGGSDWMTWALAGGGALVLLIGGGLLVSRMRGGSEDSGLVAGLDFEEDDAPADRDANPFAMSESDEETTALGGPDAETVVTGVAMDDDEATTIVASPMDSDEEKESESALFDTEEKTMDDMEVISRDQVNESLGGASMPPVGGVSEDVQQMFAEMTRRMEALEARCDELVDARDRLERQVAAQTEELRVQRAAIARTQRAVRNLGRGDESEEQEPTEPALREPTPPSGQ